MPRTFSLARLMLGITAVCLLCGLAVNVPSLGFVIAGILLVFAPTLLALLIFASFSSEPFALWGFGIPAALFGWLLVPGVQVVGRGWSAAISNYMIVAGPPFACAMAVAIPLVIGDIWRRCKAQ